MKVVKRFKMSTEARRLAVDEEARDARIAEHNRQREAVKRERARPYKRNTLPVKYQRGFLHEMDGRCQVARHLFAAFEEVTSDLGGLDRLSHIKRSLCERFVFLEAILRGIELEMAEAGPRDKELAGQLLSRWIQGLNSLVGIGRCIGLERRARQVEELQHYLAKTGRRGE